MTSVAVARRAQVAWSPPVAVQVAIALGLLGALWEVLSRTGVIDGRLFSSPSRIWTTFLELQADGEIWHHVYVTVYELLGATALVIGVGGLAGVLLGSSRLAFQVTYGPIATLFAFPKVTLFPIFITALGLGLASKVMFGALFGFFPLAMGTMVGVRGIKSIHRSLLDVVGASFWFKLRHLYLPATLPSFVAALRIGYVYTGIGILLAEMFVGVAGLGNRIIGAGYQRTLDQFWVYVVLATLVLMLGAGLFRFIELRLAKWREE